ncbi:hypothetical protein NIES4071_103230 (plasmid) [Calothrix sp. NIES-4071]|nr:hypothetical protein NIES4071_103230 [Calothrix sp. NIES-4071]BAZ64704.1 hypothetical protein NIES4105_104370 [Calothrix sp. NIES-4105]
MIIIHNKYMCFFKIRSIFWLSFHSGTAEITNTVTIFDNTTTPEAVAEIKNGVVTYQAENLPQWTQNVINKINERASERIQIENDAIQNNQQLIIADINNSKSIGIVENTTTNFIVQKIDQDTLVLHDRSIASKEVAPGQNIRIAYSH